MIMRRGTRLVFIEVRGRSRHGLVGPEDSFHCQKRRYVERCVTYYLHRNPGHQTDIRLDFAAVRWGWLLPKVRIFKGIVSIDVKY